MEQDLSPGQTQKEPLAGRTERGRRRQREELAPVAELLSTMGTDGFRQRRER